MTSQALPPAPRAAGEASVLCCGALPQSRLEYLVSRFGLVLETLADGETIPGSYWNAPEAGLLRRTVYVRADTPIHSLLHELCHLVCMTEDRRANLNTEAGGDEEEESAVCYLQILLADQLEGLGRDRLLLDMDAWGYSFRLGLSRAWFEQDAEDARSWLLHEGLIGEDAAPTWQLRG